MEASLTWEDFAKVEMRVGTVMSAEVFTAAKKPAYVMTIDFGAFGIKKSSAQITSLYQPEDLIGKQIIAVTNFPCKQIANIQSECLVLGALGDENTVTLLQPEREVKNGLKIS